MKKLATMALFGLAGTALAAPAFAGGPVVVAEEATVTAPVMETAPMPVGTDWGGAYAGAQLGFGQIGSTDPFQGEGLIGGLHAGYRNRVRMGPTWRADVWTVLERAPELSVAEVARRAGCSFAAAWQVVQDFTLLRESERLAASS